MVDVSLASSHRRDDPCYVKLCRTAVVPHATAGSRTSLRPQGIKSSPWSTFTLRHFLVVVRVRSQADTDHSSTPARLLLPIEPLLLLPQGAVSSFSGTITTEEGSTFTSNTAIAGAGGGIYCSTCVANFTGGIFTANRAVWGGGGCCFECSWQAASSVSLLSTCQVSADACHTTGKHDVPPPGTHYFKPPFLRAGTALDVGYLRSVVRAVFIYNSSTLQEKLVLSLGSNGPVRSRRLILVRFLNRSKPLTGEPGMALFSTGSAWSEAEPDTSGPANTTGCTFEHNNATDGGGIYSAAGYDIIRDCQFEANFAGEGAHVASVKRTIVR